MFYVRLTPLFTVSLGLFAVLFSCSDKSTGPKDSIPPARITTLSIVSQVNDMVTLSWLATGEDSLIGRAQEYQMRYTLAPLTDSNWSRGTVVPNLPTPGIPGKLEKVSVRISGVVASDEVYIGLKLRDEANNWSALSNVVSTNDLTIDSIPPAAITDLFAQKLDDDLVILYWSAPGDDSVLGQAFLYDIRISDSVITPENFETCDMLIFPEAPSVPGEIDSIEVSDLTLQTDYWFAIKTADNALNWSEISNVAFASTVDSVPPSQITDLIVSSVQNNELILTWTAPGSDGTIGKASAYEIRYSQSPIDQANWNSAVLVANPPVPKMGGLAEEFRIADLDFNSTYYVGIKAFDHLGLESPISNIVSAMTEGIVTILWTRTVPISESVTPAKMVFEGDGFVICGSRGATSRTDQNAYVIKVDTAGEKVWDATFGGILDDQLADIYPLEGGGFVVGGKTNSEGTGGYDAYIASITPGGIVQWAKPYGLGISDEYATGVSTGNGQIAFVGTTDAGSLASSTWIKILNYDGSEITQTTLNAQGCNLSGMAFGREIVKREAGGYFVGWDWSYLRTGGIADSFRCVEPVTGLNLTTVEYEVGVGFNIQSNFGHSDVYGYPIFWTSLIKLREGGMAGTGGLSLISPVLIRFDNQGSQVWRALVHDVPIDMVETNSGDFVLLTGQRYIEIVDQFGMSYQGATGISPEIEYTYQCLATGIDKELLVVGYSEDASRVRTLTLTKIRIAN